LVVGIDIIEIERIRRALNCFGERFLRRVYTEREVEEVKGSIASLGARFAAKEAAMKALGGGITFREVEIQREGEAPHILLFRGAREKARRMNLRRVEVSLSHSRDYAVAIVVGEN
jgi:holo-[acyl-carrier protein] synthase